MPLWLAVLLLLLALRALIGKGVDDEIHVETPSGKVVLYVNRIWYEK